MNKLILGAALATITSTAFANDFRADISGSYSVGEINDVVDTEVFTASANYYFRNVDTSKGPLLEAAFLDKSSYVGIVGTRTEYEFNDADIDFSDTSLHTRLVFGNFILEAAAADNDIADDKTYGLGIGTYITDNIDVVLTHSRFDDIDSYTWSVDFHGVNAFSGERALGWDIGLESTDANGNDLNTINIGLNYFINNAISVGTDLSHTDTDGDEIFVADIHVDYFVTPSIHLFASYTEEGEAAEAEALAIGGSFRF